MDALGLKAQIAEAEKSPTANGYLSAASAISSKQVIEYSGENRYDVSQVAPFLPGRISMALDIEETSKRGGLIAIGTEVNLPDADKAAYAKAQDDFVKAGAALVDVSLTDPDGIIGSYLKDLPPPQKHHRLNPWISTYTYVEVLMKRRPDIFNAAVAYEKAMRAFELAGNSDPGRRNVSRLMKVAAAIWSYALNHDLTLPENLEVLYKDGKYLKDSSLVKSMFTGKDYVLAAPGAKMPQKSGDRDSFILVYDADEIDGSYPCALANGSGGNLPADVLRVLLRKQGK